MIEAVNSVVSSAPLLRGNVEQLNAARSFAANPDKVQEVATAPQAPYISPYIAVDVNFDKAVLQIRDSETGDVLRQFPSESRLEAQRQAQQAQNGGQVYAEARSVELDTGRDSGGDTPSVSPSAGDVPVSAPSVNSGLAQAASAALATSAQTGIQNASAGVTVFA